MNVSSPPDLSGQLARVRKLAAELDAMFPSTAAEAAAATTPDLGAAGRTFSLPEVAGYRIESVIGRGGMGVIYRAAHLKLRRTVALKTLLSGAHATRTDLQRFAREAESIARLQHPNIVQVFDCGEAGGLPYYTMEFVEGGSLADRLDGTPLPARDTAAIVATLASAAQFAHDAGIIHRDLKPGNVLLTDQGVPKLSDFGLARWFGGADNVTLTDGGIGTPCYMSPEQASGKSAAVGPASDVYSLGAILYEMITGRPPFVAETAAEVHYQLRHHEPLPPSKLNRKISRDIDTITLKCLHKNPSRRYATASALADDLIRWLRGDPVLARPAGLAERAGKWVRRRPLHATLLATALLVASAAAYAAARVSVERSAFQKALQVDLAQSADAQRQARWSEAGVALGRAEARLGDRALPDLRRRAAELRRDLRVVDDIDRDRTLSLARRVQSHTREVSEVVLASEYRKMLAAAELGTPDEAPELVAARVRASPIRGVWVNAFDDWMFKCGSPDEAEWVSKVCRLVDPDPSGWRERGRDPVVWTDRAKLASLLESTTAGEQPALLQVELAKRLRASGGDSLDYLRRVQHEYPDDYWANAELVFVLTMDGLAKEALGYARAALALRPKLAVSHCALGYVLDELGQDDEAIAEFRRSIALDPTLVAAHVNLAITLAQRRDWVGCTEHLARARELDPTRPSTDLQVGSLMFVAGDLDGAQTRYERTIAAEPNNATAHGDLGLLLASIGKPVHAVVELNRAVELDQRQVGPRVQLAKIYMDRGEFAEVERFSREALSLEPTQAAAQSLLLAALIRQGRVDEVREQWAGVIATKPKSHDTQYGYAELCLFLGREEDYKQARASLIAQFADTRNAMTAERVARACLLMACDDEQQLQQLTALCEVMLQSSGEAPQSLRAHFLFAKALLDYRGGKLDSAAELLRRDARDVLHPAPQLLLGMIAQRQGRSDEARSTLEVAIKSFDWNPAQAVDQDGWIVHVLRREAEQLVGRN